MGMHSRGRVLLELAIASVLLVFITLAAKAMIACHMAEIIDRHTEDIRIFAVSLGQNKTAVDAVDELLDVPDITGVEAFTLDGRRVAQSGEPLEIAGYNLDRNNPLLHQADNGRRYEIFWPPASLGAGFGLAVRIDTEWIQVVSGKLMTLIVLIIVASILSIVAVSAVYLLLEKNGDGT